MPGEILLRFYEELNAYLPSGKRKREFAHPIDGPTKIRRVLKDLGVPESEVELVFVNGFSVNLSSVVSPGDRLSAYPVFESLNVAPLLRIRKEPLRRTRFLAEPGLSRLASSLRSLGFDVIVDSRIHISEEDRRILLTTDPGHLKSGLARVYVVRETVPEKQVMEIVSRLDLVDAALAGSAASAESFPS